jgi:hypothetical protein
MNKDKFDEPQPFDMERVGRMNLDLAQRLVDEGGIFAYDEDGDTLFITIGKPTPALTEHVLYDIYYQIEPESLRIVGATILKFAGRFLKNNEFFREAFEEDFQRLRAAGGVIAVLGESAHRLAPIFELYSMRR